MPNLPRVASVAFNVKGADLLFLDHLDDSELKSHDEAMWDAAHVDISKRPFKRVLVYVPLADDGLNLNTLRTNPKADVQHYSQTRPFALGIKDLWPYLHLFFDNRSTAAANLLAEIEAFFEERGHGQFTLANVLSLFKTEISLPQKVRKESNSRWADAHTSVISAVLSRLRALPTTLGGLIDVTGTGFGLEDLTNLKPFDMVVIDFERIMANPRDPEVAENAIKIITAYVLNRLTEAMTRGTSEVDHIIVFADELNRLAPRQGDSGIGAYLSQLARTTRDRGIVLFGAGQFRSGINEDILKSASVHYSMQTPDYELNDRIYAPLTNEVKARLTRLKPGEMLVQYPALRTAVFARFPRPFVMAGANTWRERLPSAASLPAETCIYKRLYRLDPDHPPQQDEAEGLLTKLAGWEDPQPNKRHEEVVQVLRDIEMDRSTNKAFCETAWEQFQQIVKDKFGVREDTTGSSAPIITPPSFVNDQEDW